MISEFQTADYVLSGIIIVMTVTGLFRGFSGTLGFALACLAAAFVGSFGWSCSGTLIAETWMRAAAVLVATLLSFGLVRFVVKKLVNGLLSQPSDAVFGAITGGLLGSLVVVVWAWSGLYPEVSFLVRTCCHYVR